MDLIERIEEIGESAGQAVASAGDLEALESVRVTYLGRKAELATNAAVA